MTRTDPMAEARRLLKRCKGWLPAPSKQVPTSALRSLYDEIEAWLSANPETNKPAAGVTERSPADYAIEFGGYLADAAEWYLKRPTETDARSADEVEDVDRGLRSAIYEFRKRAKVALASASPRSSGRLPDRHARIPQRLRQLR